MSEFYLKYENLKNLSESLVKDTNCSEAMELIQKKCLQQKN